MKVFLRLLAEGLLKIKFNLFLLSDVKYVKRSFKNSFTPILEYFFYPF